MKRLIKSKKLVTVFICFTLLLTSTLLIDVNAAKRIKSTKISLIAYKATISIGDIITLDSKITPTNSTDKVKWYTSNSKVATINQYGVVTGVSVGKATITVKTTSGKSSKCIVTVKKNLSQSEIVKLIKANVMTEDDIMAMIEENTLTEDAILELIESDIFTEEDIISLIEDKAITEEDVNSLIEEKVLSENDIEALIKENTLTEAQVEKIVSSYTVSDSKIKDMVEEYMDENYSDNTVAEDWKDGTELKLYKKQSLPMTLTYSDKKYTITSNIKKVTIKKYYYDDFYNGRYYKYKYVTKVNATIDDKESVENSMSHSLNMGVFDSKSGINETWGFGFTCADDSSISILNENSYSNSDYDSYFMSELFFEIF